MSGKFVQFVEDMDQLLVLNVKEGKSPSGKAVKNVLKVKRPVRNVMVVDGIS